MAEIIAELPSPPPKDTDYSKIIIRTYNANNLPKEYFPLIFSRWLRSLRFGAPWFKHINSDDYYSNYHKHIEMLLSKPDFLVRLALLPKDDIGPEVVVGFCCSREDVLDYVHVLSEWRNKRIGKALLPPGLTTFTNITSIALLIWRNTKNYKNLKFNPFA